MARTTNIHPADVKASLEKKGISLSGLSNAHGYHHSAAGIALRQPWPAVQRIIAAALEKEPQALWPEWWYQDGTPHRERRGWKDNTADPRRIVQKRRAA